MLQDLRFGVLGPVWARRDGIDLAVGQPQQQAVLAMLLFARGRAVSPTELVDGLWGENPPSRAIGAVRNYAYRLRRVIEPDPSKPVILRSAGSGYLLDTKADAVDATQFERLVNDAVRVRDGKENDTAEKASEALRRALALFAGEPLAGVPGPYAHAQRARLIERRLAVLEERIEADLHAGRHAVVAAELSGLLAEHPLRERLLALRMLALYRCGQRTEALNVYTQGRRRFVAELGVEPGRELRELHTRILAGEDPREARQERQPEVVAPQPRAPRPSQLPPETPDFTGRDLAIGRVRDSLLRRLESAVPISVITGLGGVGKTALAVRVAHRIKERFPDGQLYAQLRGMRDRPTPPGVVLNSFLHALGIPDRIIPESVEERSALLRSVLADRRVLIVLDEARDAGQVRPLLPGSPGSAVLITSRAKLAGLPGSWRCELGVLDTCEALGLVRKIVGDQAVAADPIAARTFIDACGRLPLAVRAGATRLASRPHWTLSLLADRLSDEHRRLPELRIDDVAVDTAFQLGYDQLDPELARAFRLLSLSSLHGFSRYSAAAVLDTSPEEAERLCDGLVDLSMLGSTGPGRYRYHDLLRLFARQRAETTDTPDDKVDAVSRLIDFHLTVALTVIGCGIDNNVLPLSLAEIVYAGMPLADMSAVRTWLTDTAGDEPAGRHTAGDNLYRLVQSVELDSIAGLDETVARLLCAASQRQRAVVRRSHVERRLAGTALSPEAPAAIESRLAKVRTSCPPGDPRLRAQIAFVAATAATMRGHAREAGASYRSVLALSGAAGDGRGEVLATVGLGRALAMLGEFEEAYELAERAAGLARDRGDQHAEAFAAHVFGQIAQLRGDDEHTAAQRTASIRLWFAVKQPVPEQTPWMPGGVFARTAPKGGMGAWLGMLGHALADLDRAEQARACWQEAADLLNGVADADTAEIRSLLAALP